MTAHPSAVELLASLDDPSGDDHAATCADCRELVHDFQDLRGRARDLGPAAWGGERPGELEVEAALAAVLGRAVGPPPRAGARRARALRAMASAAAVLLASALSLSYVLRLRVERPAAFHLPAAAEGRVEVRIPAVFWTAAPLELYAAR